VHDLETNVSNMENKLHRNVMMNDLKTMMNVQQTEFEQKHKNNLMMEKTLLKESTKFDVFVDDIVEEKRKILEKLRQQRPF